MAYYVPPSETVGGHVPSVPHQIASMATRNLCMHDVLKLHRNCDEYMDIQKERKRTFLIAFEDGYKETRSLFAAQH